MARDANDIIPIESKDQLIAYSAGGEKPQKDWRIGTEHEKFGFYTADYSPVPYEGTKGIKALLTGMQGLLGWEPIMDAGAIIGLTDPVGGGAISLEPGGQFELSGAPLDTIHQTRREISAHLAQVREISAAMGVRFLGMGTAPTWPREAVPVMPKSRYNIMTRYMPKVGALGLDMMYRTSTVQVNLDYASEADMVKKLRVSLALQPIATALFAASPFTNGRPNGFLSMRSEIWRHTDPDRTGMMAFAFEEGMGYERYVDWALDVPLYFIKRDDVYHDVAGVPFRQFLEHGISGRPELEASVSDWQNHLGTLFPEVRLKRYLEMRGADAGPKSHLCALSAFWVGLLYDSVALDAAWDLVKDWSAGERDALRDGVPRHGLKTIFRQRTVHDIAREVVALAQDGLRRRARTDAGAGAVDGTEEVYLQPLVQIIESGRTLADEMLHAYHTTWGRTLTPVFDAYAY